MSAECSEQRWLERLEDPGGILAVEAFRFGGLSGVVDGREDEVGPMQVDTDVPHVLASA
jgi:hypothetical protein